MRVSSLCAIKFWIMLTCVSLLISLLCRGDGEEEEQQEQEEDQEEEDQQEEDEEDSNEDEGEEEDNEEEGEEEDNEEEQDDNEDRKRRQLRALAQNNNVEVVDCDTCESMGCFVDEDEEDGDNNDEQEVNDETIAEWVNDLLECQETGSYWNNYEVYAGFICNEAGTGVEIGVFMDDECEIYASMVNYKSVVGEDDQAFYYSSQEIVTYPFITDVDCAQLPEYITPEEAENQEEEEDDQNDEEEEDQEANEYCQEVVDEDALPLYDCNDDGEEDQQDDEVDEEEENNYDWYTYVLSQDDAEDNQAVCKLLQTMEGEYTVVYNSDEDSGSGSFYDYGSVTSESAFGASNTLLLIVLILVSMLGLYFIAKTFCTPSKKRERLLDHA